MKGHQKPLSYPQITVRRHRPTSTTALSIHFVPPHSFRKRPAQVDILRLLMKEGYDVNTTDHEGRCPAHAAARENQVGALAVLAENARRCPPASGGSSSGGGGGGDGGGDGGTGRSIVDFDARDLGGASPLHHAVEGRHAEAAAFLCDAGANVDAVDALGNTPCWQAVVDGQVCVRVAAEVKLNELLFS